MRRPYQIYCLVIVLSLLSSCTQKKIQSPLSGGISAASQMSTIAALQKASETLRFRELEGKEVFLSASTLSSLLQREGGTGDFLHAWMRELLVRDGAILVASPAQAEIELVIQGNVLGVDRLRRDAPPLLYTEYIYSKVDLHCVAYQLRGRQHVLFTKDVQVATQYRERFWFYLFGPSVSLEFLDFSFP